MKWPYPDGMSRREVLRDGLTLASVVGFAYAAASAWRDRHKIDDLDGAQPHFRACVEYEYHNQPSNMLVPCESVMGVCADCVPVRQPFMLAHMSIGRRVSSDSGDACDYCWHPAEMNMISGENHLRIEGFEVVM